MMAGKTVVITGATSGIGRELAHRLAVAGADLVLVGRHADKLTATRDSLAAAVPSAAVDTVTADLSLQREVERAADEILARHPRIDVLINNAGAVFARRGKTEEGIERTWALNVLAPFVLTHRLLPALRAGAPSRVVMVDSEAHRASSMDLSDLEGSRHYSAFGNYGRSKLALLYVTYEFAERLAGDRVDVNAVHPGFVRTRFGLDNGGGFAIAIRVASALFAIGVARGARTPFRVATDPILTGTTGRYFVRGQPADSSRASHDVTARQWVWVACERGTGIVGVPAVT